MYQYRAAAQSTEGHHWSEFGSQLYGSAFDEKHTANSASRWLARQLECTANSISDVQPQLTSQSTHAQGAQRLPGTRYPSRTLPSCPQLSGGHDYSFKLAATSAYWPAVTSEYQPARRLGSSDPQWLSPCSRSFVARHQYQADKQNLKQNCDLLASCLPAGKSSQGAWRSLDTDDAYQTEVALLGSHLQANAVDVSQIEPMPLRLPSPAPSAARRLSALQNTTSQEMSPLCEDPSACYSAVPEHKQHSVAAALSAAAWPMLSPSPCSLPSGEIFPDSFSCQTSGCNDLFPEDALEPVRALPPLLPLSSCAVYDSCKQALASEEDSGTEQPSKASGRRKTKIDHITVEYLRDNHCFDMPLAEAAKSLDVGLSVMKRVCRTLGLARWPYRTRSSLRSVIEKTEKYLADKQLENDTGEGSAGQKAHVLHALQSQMHSVTGEGGSDLNASIKKYRQSIFKLNYKIKKSKTNCKGRHKIAVPQNAAERVLANKLRDSEAA